MIAIQQHATHPEQRVLLLTDRNTVGPFDASSLISCGVSVGCEWNPVIAECLDEAEQLLIAKRYVMVYLTNSQRTEAEIQRYLIKKGMAKAICDRTVEWVRTQGWVNDEEVGLYLIQKAQQSASKHSKNQMAAKLIKRGIPVRSVEQLLKSENYDELPAARAMAQKKWLEIMRKDREHPRAVLAGYLARKGFATATVKKVLAEFQHFDE